MTAQDLKNAILQLTVQGKLVPQDSHDEPASELLKRIKAEKEQLIKEGVIKKDKRTEYLGTPLEDDIPFDIPYGWECVYLGGILNKLTDGTHKTPQYSTSGVKFVSVKNMSTGILSLEKTKYITETEHIELYSRCNPEKGDMLLSKVGTTGVPAIVDTDEPFSLFVSVALLKYNHSCIYEKFFYYLLQSPLVQSQADHNTRGAGNKNWVLDAIAKTIIILPPLAEQKRIVAKTEELLPLVEEYGKAEERLTALNAEFPDKLRKSILQQAIQGKLTERDPADEPASELLKRIRTEKERLIKEGKTKKEKPLPPITEEEIPFEIPDGWAWTRLGTYLDVRDGTHDSPKYVRQGYPLVTSKNLKNGSIQMDDVKYISKEDYDAINERSQVDEGDILFAMIGSIGNPSIVEKKHEYAIKNVALFKRVLPVNERYLYYYLFLEQASMKKKASGGVQPFVSLGYLRNYLFPLPPLAEQQRIVDRVNELLAMCDELK